MSENNLTILDRLQEIQESIELIQQWSKGMTDLYEFKISPNRVMAFNACVMRLQVIGEQVGKLQNAIPETLKMYPQIPWHAIYGMRNFISHEYANINENIVLDVIANELPILKNAIEQMINKYQK